MNITKLKVERLILAHEEAINSLEYIARAHPTATGSWQREDALKHAKESVEILRGLAEDAEPETAMIDAAMLAMKGICPPLRRSECRQLIRAAFNATSPQAPKDAEPVLLTKFNVTGAVPAVITPTVTFATTSPQAAQTEAHGLESLFSEWFDSTPHGEPSPRETFEAGYQAGRAGSKP